MSSSYILLDVAFLGAAALLVRWLRLKLPSVRQLIIMAYCLIPAMLIFDSYLTRLPIITYDAARLIGLRLGTIPVEDFAYLVVVLVLAPALFNYFKASKKHSHEEG